METVPEGAAFDDCLIGQELISLRHITAVLREQCPWDREQRAMDIISYTIEEVYELAEVIMRGYDPCVSCATHMIVVDEDNKIVAQKLIQ